MDIEQEIADEISGIQVGSGYYSTTIGIDAAQEAAVAVMPLVKRAQAEAWERGAKDMMRAVSEEQTVSFIAPHNPYIENEGAGADD